MLERWEVAPIIPSLRRSITPLGFKSHVDLKNGGHYKGRVTLFNINFGIMARRGELKERPRDRQRRLFQRCALAGPDPFTPYLL
jgi:hypothetical protein